MTVGIVLSGGGSQGNFEVGALRYLYNQGIRPDVICGTSVGAINGLALAQGEGGLEQLEKIWLSLMQKTDMYKDEDWLATVDPLLRDLFTGALSDGGGSPSISGEDTIGLLGGGAILLSLPMIILEVIGAKVKLDKLANDLNTIMSTQAVFNLSPIYTTMRNTLLPSWLTLDPPSRKALSIAMNQDRTLEIFVRWNDRSIQHIRQSAPNGAFGNWEPLGAPQRHFTSGFGIGQNQDGTLQIIIRGDDKSFYNYSEEHDDWTTFSDTNSRFASDPVIGQNQDGTLQVFGRGLDNALWIRSQVNPYGGYNPWVSLGGHDLTGNPAVGQNLDGRLELFIKGGDNVVYHLWQTTPNGSWSGWDGGLGAPDGAATSGLAVGRNFDGVLEIFVRGNDKALWHVSQTAANNGWAAWSSLGGTIISDPVVAQNQDGRLEVFAIGTNSQLFHTWQTSPGAGSPWSAWFSLGGICTRDPIVARTQDGRLQVFVKAVDHSVQFISQNVPNHGWGEWSQLGGSIWPGIKLRMATVSTNSGSLRYITESGMFSDIPGPSFPLEDGALASSSIPAIFPPTNLQGEWYIDGGVREVLPIQMAVVEGADKIFAIAAAKDGVDYNFGPTTMIKNGLRAAMGILPDKIMHKDTTPPRGWDSSVQIIQPTLSVHDSLTIEPGLISIAIAYGFMRANDVLGPYQDQTAVPMLRLSSDSITSLRKTIWKWEITAHTAHFPTSGSGTALGGPDFDGMLKAWITVRNYKTQLKKLLDERRSIGGALPPDAYTWPLNWERHFWMWQGFPFAPTPWDQVVLGNLTLPAAPPP